jgi:hypothetical protein
MVICFLWLIYNAFQINIQNGLNCSETGHLFTYKKNSGSYHSY